MKKYTVIFQQENLPNRQWITETLRGCTAEVRVDGHHELVLDNSILVDQFVYARDPGYYTRFRGKNAFLMPWNDEFFELGRNVCRNFRGVLRPHWASAFDARYAHFFPLGYTNGAACPAGFVPKPASQREYVWSFAGEIGKTSRPDMARALSRIVPNYLYGTDRLRGFTVNNHCGGARRLPRQQCAAILRDSIFAPSPMGNACIECYRTYEALEAGSIPIVEKRLTLDYYRMAFGPHPLPTVGSWSQARGLIRDLLQSSSRLDALQKECMEWWAQYKAALPAAIGQFLARREADPEPIKDLLRLRGPQPLWQIAELLRRQTPATLMRRIAHNGRRLLATGHLRVAYSPKNRVQ